MTTIMTEEAAVEDSGYRVVLYRATRGGNDLGSVVSDDCECFVDDVEMW